MQSSARTTQVGRSNSAIASVCLGVQITVAWLYLFVPMTCLFILSRCVKSDKSVAACVRVRNVFLSNLSHLYRQLGPYGELDFAERK